MKGVSLTTIFSQGTTNFLSLTAKHKQLVNNLFLSIVPLFLQMINTYTMRQLFHLD